jgi:hypothetical protein
MTDEQFTTAGFCTKLQVEEAGACYRSWVEKVLVKPDLAMRAVSEECHDSRAFVKAVPRIS